MFMEREGGGGDGACVPIRNSLIFANITFDFVLNAQNFISLV